MADEREFEWDEEKNERNDRQHGVTFEVASRAFLDRHSIEWDDDDHDELRWNLLGYVDEKLLHVTYTLRGGVVRIISARRAERHERKRYHEI